jgi:hypothetical protein
MFIEFNFIDYTLFCEPMCVWTQSYISDKIIS